MSADLRTSRFLSRVLRHAPEAAGLTLDAQGWADVDALIEGARRHGMPLTRERLARVVAGNDKQRFAFDAAGRRIRANQGHSLDVDLGLAPQPPPAMLHHGTAARNLDAIRREGLRPGRRQHVHLSATPDVARQVGARHGSPVVLAIDAAALHARGHVFLRSANGVWLTAHVPPEYIHGYAPSPHGGA